MYSKAHQALDFKLSLTYRTHEETFQPLSSFGYVLEQKNPGTFTDLQYDEDGKFLYFFMSIGASLRGFQTCMRSVIAIDGTHLKGRFGGTMFVATTQDVNEQNAYDYVNTDGPHKWSHVHCPERREQNLDFTSLFSDYYKRQTLIDEYSVPIMLVGYSPTWVVPSDIVERVILNPISRRQTGRPRAGQHVSFLKRTNTQSCRRCGQPRHNSRRCSNPPLINEGPSRGVPDEYRHKCSICHSIGHNKQTYPNRE
ncbi:hypothetical protein Ddye_011199 [Dipteronia dyeriana]|uniref:CCHC-type domain-containing protein n=1 Tax=Dipteronia dyeriana TaxID=168575 RepID=A0AAD9UBS2_9ROSI|nr:hypothetical protein Ddye_011199 [Dipteronia dyeriana]